MILTLSALRYRVNLSQSELARRTKISQPMFSNYERGLTIPLRHAETILKVLRDADVAKLWVPESILPEDLTRSWSWTCDERKVE